MKMNIFGFDESIYFYESQVTILEIETPILMKKIVQGLIDNRNGESSEESIALMVDDQHEEINSISKNEILIDFFNLDLNSKKILTNIEKLVEDELKFDVELKEAESIESQKLRQFLVGILEEIDLPLKLREDIKIKDMLKIFSLKLDVPQETDIFEKLLTFIDLFEMFRLGVLLTLVNVKSYLSDADLVELYRYAINKKIHLLLLESDLKEGTLEYEHKVRIDSDFVETIL